MQTDRQFSLQAGKDPRKGKKGSVQIRQNRKACQVATAAFPAAMGAVKLSKRTGFQSRMHSRAESFQKMYDGVMASYNRIANAPEIDLSKDKALQLGELVANVRKMTPKGVDVIIQEDINGNWIITVLREVNWNYGWACFPVGKIFKALRREDSFLHNVFLEFIKTFSCLTGVDLWYHGLMGEEIESMDERLLNIEDEEGPDSEIVKDFYKTIHYYGQGLPHQYEQELRFMGPVADIEWFIGAVDQYKKHPIAKIIREGVEILRHKKRITDYQIYHADKEGSFFLPLDLEFCIAWSLSDLLASEAEERLGSYSMEGVEEPVQYLAIKEGVTVKNFDQFKQEDTFIEDLQKYFDRTWLSLNKIKKYA